MCNRIRVPGQRGGDARADDARDTILGLSLDCGGHLTHGMRLNFSGKLYRSPPMGFPGTTT